VPFRAGAKKKLKSTNSPYYLLDKKELLTTTEELLTQLTYKTIYKKEKIPQLEDAVNLLD